MVDHFREWGRCEEGTAEIKKALNGARNLKIGAIPDLAEIWHLD